MGIGEEKNGARPFTSLDEPSRQYEENVHPAALYPEEGDENYTIGNTWVT
jgi:hypothetical protein